MQKIALGLDISKQTIDAYFNGQEDFIHVMNNQAGIEKLIERIKNYQQQSKEIHACCEYTGVYYLPLASALHDSGIKISVINPLSIKLYAEYRLRRTKTDKQVIIVIFLFIFSLLWQYVFLSFFWTTSRFVHSLILTSQLLKNAS